MVSLGDIEYLIKVYTIQRLVDLRHSVTLENAVGKAIDFDTDMIGCIQHTKILVHYMAILE